jgi:hypothetical protein
MEKSAFVVDFAMPGAERLIFEAVLFDCVPIINDELNGASEIDFPLPRWLRVAGRNVSAVEDVVRRALAIHPQALQQLLLPFVRFVEGMRSEFLRSVRRYFSGCLHVVIRTSEFSDVLMLQVMSVLVAVPLATVSVIFRENVQLVTSLPAFLAFRAFLAKHYFLSAVEFTVAANIPKSAAYVLVVDAGRFFFVSENIAGGLATETEIRGGQPFRVEDVRHGLVGVFPRDGFPNPFRLSGPSSEFIRNSSVRIFQWRSAAGRMYVSNSTDFLTWINQRLNDISVWRNFFEDFPALVTAQ